MPVNRATRDCGVGAGAGAEVEPGEEEEASGNCNARLETVCKVPVEHSTDVKKFDIYRELKKGIIIDSLNVFIHYCNIYSSQFKYIFKYIYVNAVLLHLRVIPTGL